MDHIVGMAASVNERLTLALRLAELELEIEEENILLLAPNQRRR